MKLRFCMFCGEDITPRAFTPDGRPLFRVHFCKIERRPFPCGSAALCQPPTREPRAVGCAEGWWGVGWELDPIATRWFWAVRFYNWPYLCVCVGNSQSLQSCKGSI